MLLPPIPDVAIRWAARLLLVASVGLLLAGFAYRQGVLSERGRLAERVETLSGQRERCQQREVDLGAQLRVAEQQATERQQRVQRVIAAPPRPAVETVIHQIETHVPAQSDACLAAVSLLDRYHLLARQLRLDAGNDAAEPGAGEPPVPDADRGAAAAAAAAGGAAAQDAVGREGPGDRPGSGAPDPGSPEAARGAAGVRPLSLPVSAAGSD